MSPLGKAMSNPSKEFYLIRGAAYDNLTNNVIDSVRHHAEQIILLSSNAINDRRIRTTIVTKMYESI